MRLTKARDKRAGQGNSTKNISNAEDSPGIFTDDIQGLDCRKEWSPRMKRTWQVRILAASGLAALLWLGAGAPLRAQTGFGQISGSVTDNTRAVVPGVSVKARNIDTNVATETVTSSDGIFNILSLLPGNYE